MEKNIKELEREFECIISEKRIKIWEIQLEMWKLVDQICRENDIRYYFFWGSLLGAVRHKGFIPWDDDIDLVMPRKDYNKFSEIVSKQIKEPFFFLTEKTVGDGIYSFIKVVNTNTTCIINKQTNPVSNYQGICIDIVPLDGVPRKKIRRKLQYILLRLDSSLINKRVTNSKTLGIGGKILKAFSFFYCMGKTHSECTSKLEKHRAEYDWDDCTEVVDAAHYRRYEKKMFEGEPVFLKFEGYDVPVPPGYRKILNQLYGDYNRLPGKKYRILSEEEAAGAIIEPDISYKDFYEISMARNNSIAKDRHSFYHRYVD